MMSFCLDESWNTSCISRTQWGECKHTLTAAPTAVTTFPNSALTHSAVWKASCSWDPLQQSHWEGPSKRQLIFCGFCAGHSLTQWTFQSLMYRRSREAQDNSSHVLYFWYSDPVIWEITPTEMNKEAKKPLHNIVFASTLKHMTRKWFDMRPPSILGWRKKQLSMNNASFNSKSKK